MAGYSWLYTKTTIFSNKVNQHNKHPLKPAASMQTFPMEVGGETVKSHLGSDKMPKGVGDFLHLSHGSRWTSCLSLYVFFKLQYDFMVLSKRFPKDSISTWFCTEALLLQITSTWKMFLAFPVEVRLHYGTAAFYHGDKTQKYTLWRRLLSLSIDPATPSWTPMLPWWEALSRSRLTSPATARPWGDTPLMKTLDLIPNLLLNNGILINTNRPTPIYSHWKKPLDSSTYYIYRAVHSWRRKVISLHCIGRLQWTVL